MRTAMWTREQFEAQTRAYKDAMDRIARNDPDWGVYDEGDERPKLPRWRRVLKL